ncbi:MAG: ester cyclase [Proteobacteria bacterium]|nr:ester cyclase [Pseudomonadota bacterium]
MSKINQSNKEIVWGLWQRLNHVTVDELADALATAISPEIAWHGPHPIDEITGVDNLTTNFWQPLRHAFPDLKRTCDIFIGGENLGEYWVTATGYFTGTFANDWLMNKVAIPATREKTYIRFGQFCVLEDGKISESYLILDMLAVLRQGGFQLLPPARGAEGGRVPPPRTNDGVKLLEQDTLVSRQTMQLVMAMISGMRRYDGQNLDSMEQEHYWHPQFRWYGPSGIGTSRSLTEYQEFHQGPWLRAFPDRGVPPDGPGRSMGFVAEGHYAAGGIWDRPYATHSGGYVGLAPTHVHLTIRDFDWWRRDRNLIVENWVSIDMIDMFKQLGIDLLARMQEQYKYSQVGRSRKRK